MTNPHTGLCVFDVRMLSILGTLYDVQSRPKAAIYDNTSSKNKLDELIMRGFITEMPVPFSNKRLCSISPRGRTLFELLTVIEAVWDSDPRADIRFNLTYRDADASDGDGDGTEHIAETPIGDGTVREVIPVDDIPREVIPAAPSEGVPIGGDP